MLYVSADQKFDDAAHASGGEGSSMGHLGLRFAPRQTGDAPRDRDLDSTVIKVEPAVGSTPPWAGVTPAPRV